MIRLLSHAEQVAEYLRKEIYRGRWVGHMPGESKLEAELGANHNTLGEALQLLEKEGLLVNQGPRKRRLIALPKNIPTPALRVGFLLSEPSDNLHLLILSLRRELGKVGHIVTTASKTLKELNMDVNRVTRVVNKIEVDLWIVFGASANILRWFDHQNAPYIACVGNIPPDIKIAAVGPDYGPIWVALVQKLVALGHQRIMLLTRSGSKPYHFIAEMKNQGLEVGPYHLPHWDPDTLGLEAALDALLKISPPTAIIIDQASQFIPIQHSLARRGIFAPHDISLICTEEDPSFPWMTPSVAHLQWDFKKAVQAITRWVNKVPVGTYPKRKRYIKAEFVDGGTIGPVKK